VVVDNILLAMNVNHQMIHLFVLAGNPHTLTDAGDVDGSVHQALTVKTGLVHHVVVNLGHGLSVVVVDGESTTPSHPYNITSHQPKVQGVLVREDIC
jgi:hypothetical protein